MQSTWRTFSIRIKHGYELSLAARLYGDRRLWYQLFEIPSDQPNEWRERRIETETHITSFVVVLEWWMRWRCSSSECIRVFRSIKRLNVLVRIMISIQKWSCSLSTPSVNEWDCDRRIRTGPQSLLFAMKNSFVSKAIRSEIKCDWFLRDTITIET